MNKRAWTLISMTILWVTIPLIAAAEESRIPWRTVADEAPTPSIGPVFTGLVLAIGGLLISLGIYRRFVPGAIKTSGTTLKIKERISLSPRTHLYLLEIKGKEYICSVGSDTVTVFPEHAAEFDFMQAEDTKEGADA